MSIRSESGSPSREYSGVVQVFEPHSLTLPPMGEYVTDLNKRRTFITELATAEIRGQQSSTLLGELWALVDPLFQAAIYYFLFTVIRGSSGGTKSSEFVTVIIGSVFLFNFTRIALTDGGRSVLRHKGLVLNAIFPRALLPIAEVYKGFLSTLPALAIYTIIHLALRAPITQAILLLPFLMLIQAGMNLGFAFLLSTVTVFVKDVANLMNYIVRILTFATPVVYPASVLTPSIKTILIWNPLLPLFTAYQAIITGQMPSAGDVFASVVWAIVLLSVGIWLFLRHERSFALHV
jgi:ABC-type polysaccharide/polyol phosphate export permease